MLCGNGHQAALPARLAPKSGKTQGDILPTPEVIDKIEQEQGNFVAIIHVTC
jgi:hypothetical protein